MHTQILRGVILMIVLTQACACATVRGTAPVNIDQSSPQALARSYHQAVEERNFAAMLECVEPDRQAEFDAFLVDAKRAWEKMMAFADAVEENIDPQYADDVRQRARESAFPSPFTSAVANGVIAWEVVRFTTEGDEAFAEIEAQTCFRARRIEGRWYVALPADEGGQLPDIRMARSMYQGAARAADKYIRRVRTGKMTREDLEEMLYGTAEERERQALWANVPWGPAISGVRIRLLPLKPVYAREEPVWLILEIDYGDGPPVCFRFPCGLNNNGFGDNATVTVDGQTVEGPQDTWEQVCGITVGMLSSTSLGLPEELQLAPGTHTVRYELVSEGGMYRASDGTECPILDGKLVSNTLTFVVE